MFTGFLQRKKRYIKNKKRYVSAKYRQRNVNRKQTGIALCDFDLPDAVGYHGADLDLPAGPYEIEDGLQRAHVP